MRFDILIFDFDGTLADTLPVCIGSFQKVLLNRTGRPWSETEIVAHFGLSEEGILQRLMPDLWEESLPEFLDHYERGQADLRPFPGIEEALGELRRRGARLAMVTGKGAETARISLAHYGLAGWFEAIETGSMERNMKADHIRAILRNMGVAPGRAAYIGDAPSDMDSAAEAGVAALGAAWFESADPQALRERGATEVFLKLDDFLNWL